MTDTPVTNTSVTNTRVTKPTLAAQSARSLAASSKFKTFALTFAIASPILYLICVSLNLPLFTYHPAVNRIDLLWSPPRSGEGPAMYWYGWTLSVLIGGTIVSILVTMLPDRVTRKIPLYLVWVLPILAVVLLAYSLREFWLR
jgi:hypothetical protein